MNEDQLHNAVAQYLNMCLYKDIVWYHPPNGGKRNAREAAKFKRMGVLAGVPDLCFILPGGTAAYIELKVEGSYLRPSQKQFKKKAEALGAKFAVCRSIEDVRETLNEWGI